MSESADRLTRRSVIASAGAVGLGAATLATSAAAATSVPPPVDTGVTTSGKVIFPPSSSSTETQPQQPPTPQPRDTRAGFAVAGLGKLALEQILPAFAQSKQAKLTALIGGTPDKMAAIASNTASIRLAPTVTVTWRA